MTAAIVDGKFLHTCEVCNKRASFGFGVNLRAFWKSGGVRTQYLGRWWCRKHIPERING